MFFFTVPLIVLPGRRPDSVQAAVAVASQGFLVYRIYVCTSWPPSPLLLYSQPFSQREKHCHTTLMGKEFGHTSSFSFTLPGM